MEERPEYVRRAPKVRKGHGCSVRTTQLQHGVFGCGIALLIGRTEGRQNESNLLREWSVIEDVAVVDGDFCATVRLSGDSST